MRVGDWVYDATRAIRSWEGTRSGAQRIPIVALTANALVGDAETCRAAGMDDHLAKPYTRKQLTKVLARWLPPALVASTAPPAPPPPTAAPASGPDDSLLDAAALENIRALDDGDGSVIVEVLQMYLPEAPGHLERLQSALERSDAADLGRVAHALKSASFNVGAMSLGETCRRLEHVGKSGSLDGAAQLVAGIERQYRLVEPELKAQMNWGNEVDCKYAHYSGCGKGTLAVDALPLGLSPFGILNMAGNVAEWVNDRYAADYYQESPMLNPTGPSNGYSRVVRGGYWGDTYLALRSTRREGVGADKHNNGVGFRCALTP